LRTDRDVIHGGIEVSVRVVEEDLLTGLCQLEARIQTARSAVVFVRPDDEKTFRSYHGSHRKLPLARVPWLIAQVIAAEVAAFISKVPQLYSIVVLPLRIHNGARLRRHQFVKTTGL
jgi:hypothetical protein